MFLLYVDESGDVNNPKDDYFVLGGAAIYETTAYFISEDLDQIQEKWFPSATEPIEFHAAEMFNRNGEPWHSLKRNDCEQIMRDLCNAICSSAEKGLYLFGVAFEKTACRGERADERAFHELCGHFDKFIHQVNLSRQKEERNRGFMILDSSRYAGHLDRLLLEYRKKEGTKFGRVRNFADAPAFAKSSTTRLLQVADLVAYAVFKRYQRGDTRLLDSLMSRFQQSDGVLHGLTHWTINWRDCFCPACASRRRASH
jgi:hypothetical protein